jgi:ribonuclease-3
VRAVRRAWRAAPGPLSLSAGAPGVEETGAADPGGEADLRAALGIDDLADDILELALTHRSYAYEHGGLPTNERLEFLGDAVLGLVVTETLYRSHPELSEGRLAKLRAAVVNARALAEIGRTLGLGTSIRLGRGELATGGCDKSSILADTVEAVIGAVHIDLGIEAATALVHRMVDPLLAEAASLGAGLDWKTSLQELAANTGLGQPEYLVTEDGPDHLKTFTAQVRVAERVYGNGSAGSKKQAEQQAAEAAWREISAGLPDPLEVDG